ncbi:MAG: sensor histidine kinase [Anaerolineales bacterium]|nr:sensor histidine kinase [Anaerolineales bacterium]
MFAFTRLSFARQFMLLSFLILLGGMGIIGLWVGQQIELGVINRTAAVTSLYVDSFVAPLVQDLSHSDRLGAPQVASLDRLLRETSLGREIVAFKVWSPDGFVLYSPNEELIGRKFRVDEHLEIAFSGEVSSEISDLEDPEDEFESQLWDELIETYLPIRGLGTGEIIAVAEFYQTLDFLQAEIRAAQLRSWLVVGAATVAMYLLLAGLVGQASNTILAQQDELHEKVEQNIELNRRLRLAAARTTALNEQFLRRISADLHDGPGQDLSLALLRIEALAETCEQCPIPVSNGRAGANDFRTIRVALDSAMDELRTISAGLRLPELNTLSPAEVVERAVRDYQRKSGQRVEVTINEAPNEASMPAKITLYRLVQEALSNGYRHAGGAGQTVLLEGGDGSIHIEVADTGVGFDPQSVPQDGHLGLAGMRERVRVLGGTFSVESAPGQGVRVRATIQLDETEAAE